MDDDPYLAVLRSCWFGQPSRDAAFTRRSWPLVSHERGSFAGSAVRERGEVSNRILSLPAGKVVMVRRADQLDLQLLFAPENAGTVYICDLIRYLTLLPVICNGLTAGVYSVVVIDNAKTAD